MLNMPEDWILKHKIPLMLELTSCRVYWPRTVCCSWQNFITKQLNNLYTQMVFSHMSNLRQTPISRATKMNFIKSDILTTVSRPETSDDTRSLPARAQTIVLCAPDTAGPWSAVTMRHISKNLHTYVGRQRWNHRRDTTPPIPTSRFKTCNQWHRYTCYLAHHKQSDTQTLS